MLSVLVFLVSTLNSNTAFGNAYHDAFVTDFEHLLSKEAIVFENETRFLKGTRNSKIKLSSSLQEVVKHISYINCLKKSFLHIYKQNEILNVRIFR